MDSQCKTMRDCFIEELTSRMDKDKRIFFLCADFGSPKLDELRKRFKDRFINVGIAEQNLINISTGLALEGFIVYAYAIAPFLTMRAFEQIRVNISLQSQIKKMNINLIGVGAGLSYDVSGPTHHCLEDISIIRTLPNVSFFSPSDWVLAKNFVDYSLREMKPKYLRFDGKPSQAIYNDNQKLDFETGFREIIRGDKVCLVSTGFMTQSSIKAAKLIKNVKVGVIDIFMLRPFNEKAFIKTISKYKYVLTVEEGFIGKGGLDSLVLSSINDARLDIKLKRLGFSDTYTFTIGNRCYLHKINHLDDQGIAISIKKFAKNNG